MYVARASSNDARAASAAIGSAGSCKADSLSEVPSMNPWASATTRSSADTNCPGCTTSRREEFSAGVAKKFHEPQPASTVPLRLAMKSDSSEASTICSRALPPFVSRKPWLITGSQPPTRPCMCMHAVPCVGPGPSWFGHSQARSGCAKVGVGRKPGCIILRAAFPSVDTVSPTTIAPSCRICHHLSELGADTNDGPPRWRSDSSFSPICPVSRGRTCATWL